VRAVAAAGVVVFLVAAGVAGGAESASRIVERTLVCNVPEQDAFPDPIRFVSASAVPKRNNWSASISAFTLEGEGDADFAAGLTTGPVPRNPTGYVAWSRAPQCSRSSRHVPFSTAGLEGWSTLSAKIVKCDTPAKVLIHLRAVFTKPVTIGLDTRTNQVTAKGNITNGQLVVATLKGKRLAYAAADGGTGKVKLFSAKFPTCS
jgi:hypothetical protein